MPTKHDDSRLATPRGGLEEARLGQILGYQLAQAAIVTYEVFDRLVGRPMDLRPTEYTILMLINENPGGSGVALSQALSLSRPYVSNSLDKLEAAHQVVVRAGPYAAIRHPSYAGNLLTLAGFGIVLENWASLAAVVVIPLVAHLPRIRVEDALLVDRLGDPYREYAATTARLVPGVW